MTQASAHPLLFGLGFAALVLGSGCVMRPGLAPRAGAQPVSSQPAASSAASPAASSAVMPQLNRSAARWSGDA
ncbi:MAG: hypothetical protein WCI65_02405, partial [Synechococcaceae cyanobacterium ELA263]